MEAILLFLWATGREQGRSLCCCCDRPNGNSTHRCSNCRHDSHGSNSLLLFIFVF